MLALSTPQNRLLILNRSRRLSYLIKGMNTCINGGARVYTRAQSEPSVLTGDGQGSGFFANRACLVADDTPYLRQGDRNAQNEDQFRREKALQTDRLGQSQSGPGRQTARHDQADE